MSEVVHHPQQEFWRPPAAKQQDEAALSAAPAMVDACDGCGTEFMVGSRFCYSCGSPREVRPNSASTTSWAHFLEFHTIKQALGLPVASLIAFLAGLGCLLAAIAVGFIYSVQNFADFQAIQFWRMQWLLAAVAAFVAGILLKHTGAKGTGSPIE
jgi:hypothetical protein